MYKPYLLPVKISESCILSIQFYAGSKFCVINTIAPLNPIQAGVFWNHIDCAPPLFLLYLWSNYNQTWHDDTLGQNLSKAIKSLLTSSLGGKYDVNKPLFWYRFRSKLEFPYLFSNGTKIWHRGQF